MTIIPHALYSKEILTILRDCVIDRGVKHSYQIDDIQKDKLCSFAIKELEYDVDINFSSKALKNISDYIINRDYDDFIDFHHQIKEDSFNHFSDYFDLMIEEIIDQINYEKSYDLRISA